MVSVAVRLEEVFFETSSVTGPDPVPGVPEDTTTHETGLTAVHGQFAAVMTSTVNDVADAETVCPFEDSEYAQV